jgi:hypothetical protein
MVRRSALLLVLAAVCVCATHAAAVAGEPRTHDGLFVRVSAGAGAAHSGLDDPAAEFDLSGAVTDLNLAIGRIVAPNLAVHGTLWGWSMADPDADVTLTGFGSTSGSLSGTVVMSGIGGGVTWYLMPANLYLSGSLSLGRLNLDASQLQGDTDRGVALDLSAGKEWWVGGAWGLGLAGGFTFHSFPDPAYERNWTGTSYSVRVSATYN